MKKITYIVLSFAAAAFLASCEKQIEVTPESDGQFVVTASIDQPTKATLSDDAGAFAFSNGDQIAICNDGSTICTGTTTSTSNTGTFTMPGSFNGGLNGIAGFPASLVSAMTPSSVTFSLPTSYTYSEVGGDDPDAAKVVAPMIGTYTAGNNIVLKHAGAVVRIRLTNLAAGSVSISFPTYVTGNVTIDAIPTESDEGILAENFTNSKGNTITITDVPAVSDGSYIYVTLPVPTRTAPQNILVTNEPSDASGTRMVALTGSSTTINRAGGYKMSARPAAVKTPVFKVGASSSVAFAPGNLMAHIGSVSGNTYVRGVADEFKFGGYLEAVGFGETTGNYLFYVQKTDDCVGKWVDLFTFQGNSSTNYRYNGLITKTANAATSHGTGLGESTYPGCWETDATNSGSAGTIRISNGGSNHWRPMTASEWNYLLFERATSTLNGTENARFAEAMVAGTWSLLIFPDDLGDIGENAWNTATMGDKPDNINKVSECPVPPTNTYTSSNLLAMIDAGVACLPAGGCVTIAGTTYNPATNGLRYYTNTSSSTTANQAMRVRVGSAIVEIGDNVRTTAMSVRLVKDVDPE